MFPLGIALVYAGYGIGSWGWVLVKGYNITLRQWFSPLHPWQWPASTSATIPKVPKGSLFPTSGTASTSGTGGTTPTRPPPPV